MAALLPFNIKCPKCGNTDYNDRCGPCMAREYAYIIIRYRPKTWRNKLEHMAGFCGACRAWWKMRCKDDDELLAEVLKGNK